MWMRISLSEQRWSGGGGTIGYGGSGPQGGYEFGETEDYYVESYLSALDWGDAPDPVTAPGYPTLLLNNGARHFIVPGGPFMGGAVDPDPDGQPTLAADGDDLDLDGDDEDGVTFGPLRWGDPRRAGQGGHVELACKLQDQRLDRLQRRPRLVRFRRADHHRRNGYCRRDQQFLLRDPGHPAVPRRPDLRPLPLQLPGRAGAGRWRT